MSTKDTDEERVIHSKSDKIKTMINDERNEVKKAFRITSF